MVTFKIYQLRFTSPLHISCMRDDGGISQRTIHSDTLYSALMACLAKIGYEIPTDGNLGFSLSSMFPYYQETENSQPILFLPMPLRTRLPELKDVSKAKIVKKVQWIDSLLYDKVLAGINFFDGSEEYIPFIQDGYLTKDSLPSDVNGSKDFIKSEVSQRVMIKSRIGEEDAMPYYIDKITFRDYSGLYFLAEGKTEPLELLDKAMTVLSQEGIGTDRNVGLGFFSFKTNELSLELPNDGSHMVSLSTLIPENEHQLHQMIASDETAYDFTRRGGWITTYPYNTLRKNAIYAFLPGSVFGRVGNDAYAIIGKIVELTPNIGDMTPSHHIWRNGKSIMLPMKLN